MNQLLEQGIAVLRVSGEDQKKGYGWDVQQEHIEAFVEEHNIAMSRFIKFQERATTLDRQEFEAILDEIIGEARRGSIQWVLFGRANRLNRHDWSWMDYLSRLFELSSKSALPWRTKWLRLKPARTQGSFWALFPIWSVGRKRQGHGESSAWRGGKGEQKTDAFQQAMVGFGLIAISPARSQDKVLGKSSRNGQGGAESGLNG
jgi:hypothetical protein